MARFIPNLRVTALLSTVVLLLASCSPESEDEKQKEQEKRDEAYIAANEQYFSQCAAQVNQDGTPYYTQVVPAWNSGVSVLMHYFNDRALTAGNLRPLFTSTVAVKYHGELYNGTLFDSSYANTDSLFTTSLTSVVEGWAIALTQMNVGDSVRVIIPASAGYGATAKGNIPAYSTLSFNIKLVDIPHYETN